MNVEIWHLVLSVTLFLLGVCGLVIAIVRWKLGTLAKGQEILFDRSNMDRDRIQQLEKFALVVDVKTALRFIAAPKEEK